MAIALIGVCRRGAGAPALRELAARDQKLGFQEAVAKPTFTAVYERA